MADTIKLVQGDSYPTIKLTLYEGDGDTRLDLSKRTNAEVWVYFREAGTTGKARKIKCGITAAADGEVGFDFTAGVLEDIDPGQYEGEIVIEQGDNTETVYDILRFRVRDRMREPTKGVKGVEEGDYQAVQTEKPQ